MDSNPKQTRLLNAPTEPFIRRRERILAVEDNPANRSILSLLLADAGYEIFLAGDGAEAIEVAPIILPDLILLDIMMPEIDGFDTCAEIMKMPGMEGVPILFMTSLTDNESKMRAFELGAVDYLTKPFYGPELLARIRIHLRFRQSYQTLVRENLHQMTFLKEAQQVLMPEPESLPQARFEYAFYPLQEVGGDFFDVFAVNEDVTDYVVADISGHDVGAFLPTAALKALIRQNAALAFDPAENLKLTNRHFKEVLKDGQYATIAYLRIDRKKGTMTIANAGHVPIVVQSHGRLQIVECASEPVGCFDRFEGGFDTLPVTQRDRIYLFSDGLIEQWHGNPVPRGKGMQYLADAVATTAEQPLSVAIATIMDALHPDRTQAEDDLLLMGIEV